VDKSSLLNALFDTSLVVSVVKSTTKESVAVQGSNGHSLTFWDMPGIGETERVDDSYLSLYRQKLMESDVVLWVIHADARSTLLDSNAFSAILSDSPLDEQRALAAKLTFVLTKADLLTPPPWIFLRDGEAGSFLPSRKIRVPGDAKVTLIDPRDVAAVAAVVLIEDGHEGRTYTLTGPEPMTYRFARPGS
jgi:predicted GTPase